MDTDNSNGHGSKKTKRQMKTPSQLQILEETYALDAYPSEATRARLSKSLGLSDRQLQIWFSNRRIKHRKQTFESYQQMFLNSSKPGSVVTDRGGVDGCDPCSRPTSKSGSGSALPATRPSPEKEIPATLEELRGLLREQARRLDVQETILRRLADHFQIPTPPGFGGADEED